MFEVGRKYVITSLDAEISQELHSWAVYEIERVDGPLVMARAGNRTVIFNTHSPKFVKAELISNDMS